MVSVVMVEVEVEVVEVVLVVVEVMVFTGSFLLSPSSATAATPLSMDKATFLQKYNNYVDTHITV